MFCLEPCVKCEQLSPDTNHYLVTLNHFLDYTTVSNAEFWADDYLIAIFSVPLKLIVPSNTSLLKNVTYKITKIRNRMNKHSVTNQN